MLFVALFLVVLITLLFLFGSFVQKRNVALVVVSSAFAGLACSVIILILFALYFCYMRGNWKDISNIEKTAGLLMIYTAVSVIRGTFALAAFTSLVYRYLPKLVDFIRSKYRSRQTEGAMREK